MAAFDPVAYQTYTNSLTNTPVSQAPGTPEDIWAWLKAGNERFVRGDFGVYAMHLAPHLNPNHRAQLANGQKPFAVVVACSDSRVPVELLFNAGLGQLFVIRVAGNVLTTTTTASVVYGVEHLGATLILVLGHTKCGAVTATIQADGKESDDCVGRLLAKVQPSVLRAKHKCSAEQLLITSIQENAITGALQLAAEPALKEHFLHHKLAIKAGVYHLETGVVEEVPVPFDQGIEVHNPYRVGTHGKKAKHDKHADEHGKHGHADDKHADEHGKHGHADDKHADEHGKHGHADDKHADEHGKHDKHADEHGKHDKHADEHGKHEKKDKHEKHEKH